MIEIQNVTKRFGARTALSNVCLRLEAGEITLLLGSNGAGKSTLLRCLLGITDFEGSIRVDGRDPLGEGCAVRSSIGYMPQSCGLHPGVTVMEAMQLFAAIRSASADRIEVLVRESGLQAFAQTKVAELSGGLRQRLAFAVALLTDPRVLILDEPSASLDAASREWLAGRLRAAAAEGRTVIVSTHAGEELRAAGDRQVILEDGRVVGDIRKRQVRERQGTAAASAGRAGSARPLIMREIKDAIGNKWLIGYAAALGLLGLAAAANGIGSSAGLGVQTFGRTTATLMNLCLLLSPLVAVLMGAATIAGERERGTLEHLLAQPLTRTRLLLGKHAGILSALSAATIAGFIPAGMLIGWSAGPSALASYALFPALASVIGVAMAGIGLLISVTSRTAVQAQGAGIMTWFLFVLLYDLILMGSLAFTAMPIEALAAGLVLNPVDAGRVLGVLALEPDLYLLGPAGAYLTSSLSVGGTVMLLFGSLALWTLGPLVLAVFTFELSARARRTKDRAVAGTAVAGRRTRTVVAMLALAVGLTLASGCSSDDDKDDKDGKKKDEAAHAAVTPAMLEQGRTLYKTNCAACHGDTGKGDGPAAGVLKPPPRDHTDRAYMDALSDEEIERVIKMGGAIKGKPLMPSHPQFKEPELHALVAYVRSLSRK
jgi:Cu-processing system permease protein